MKSFSLPVFITFVLMGLTATLSAQQKYGNEWIDPSKVYLKLKVAQDGIYRVTFEELEAAGFQNNSIDGSALKLINFGNEQPIFVSDNDFGNGDYFEFYGEKNRIGLDSLLFADWKKDLLNPEYSFVTDTNAYFLTLSPESSNLRYTNVNNDYSNITQSPFPYYLHEEKVVFSNSYYKNAESQIRYSNFEPSEGFGTDIRSESTIPLNNSNLVTSGPDPILSFRLGLNSQLARLEISFNNIIKETKILSPKLTYQFVYNLSHSEIKSINTLKILNTYSTNDKHILSFAELKYPRSFNFGNKSDYTFKMTASSQLRLIEVNEFKTNGSEVILYDVTKNLRYNTSISSGKIQALIKPSLEENKFVLIDSNDGTQKVPNMVVFNPKKFENAGQQYVIISNKALYESGPNYVQEYADYRSSEIGGNYKTDIIEIQDIYDHFGYGIDRHFMGIKQLALFMKEQWPAVDFVFIIGKGLEYPYHRTTNDIINNDNFLFFVPTFGYIGSDNMLFSENNFPDPYFAVGRLAARNANDISKYLDKIKQYDLALKTDQTINDKYWMKRVMHLGGGTTPNEQSLIKSNLASMSNIIVNSLMGAEVSSYFKTNTDVLQSAISEEIKKNINDGLNIITFFGHSATTTFDFSLESPKEYNNFGKYPFINSLGCYSGNIHTFDIGISENFVFEKDKGSIGFLASSGTAFINALGNYGKEFYDLLANKNYGSSVGKINQFLAHKYRNSTYSDLTFYQQQTLHGDPALKFYHSDGPDITFDYKSIKTIPQIISSTIKEFSVNFDIINLGKYVNDSIEIYFEHILPDNTIADTTKIKIKIPASRSNHTIVFDNSGIKGIGKNTIRGVIDLFDQIEEFPIPNGENNNVLMSDLNIGYDFYILDNSLFPVSPAPYAIINDENATLNASTSNAFLSEMSYQFEIDTTELFDSPALNKTIINSKGGLISWKPDLKYIPNTVYYWRVSPTMSQLSQEGLWQTSSFIYIPNGKDGWNQSHYYQYRNNNQANTININENRIFNFPPSEYYIEFKNNLYTLDLTGYRVNLGNRYKSILPWVFTNGGAVSFVVQNPNMDSPTNIGGFLINSGGDFGSVFNGSGNSTRTFAFYTKTAEDRKKIIDFIENHIPDSSYVTFFTVLSNINDNVYAEEWENDEQTLGKSLTSLLKSEGAEKIDQLVTEGTLPYIFMFQKGVKPIAEKISNNINELIESQMSIPKIGSEGTLKTVEVGPASNWDRIDYKLVGSNNNDTILLKVIGIKKDGSTEIIAEDIKGDKYDISNVSAAIYPMLKIELFIKDVQEQSLPQVEYLRVYYNPVNEIAISTNDFQINQPDSITQGENFKIEYVVKNLNSIVTDSIDVKTSFIDLKTNKEVFTKKTLRKLISKDDFIKIEETFSSKDMLGEYFVVCEVNSFDRFKEKYYFNNIGKKTLKVVPYMGNPLLDVFFDGIQIMDGDIISPKPEILMTLKSDNPFIPITDPNLFEIMLDTGRNQLVEIPMESPQIKFTAADLDNKTAKVLYYPELKEGEYKLIVQGKDATGNKSSINAKAVNFRVVEKQSVSNVLNYPNPFSTSTQFVFTLTGEQIPEIMSISIMTISGKVVKEITKEELGPLHIGINRTEYKWDGTDDFGNKLANGVYLYKVNIRKSDGSKYDDFINTKTDVFFKNGFGKMVILR